MSNETTQFETHEATNANGKPFRKRALSAGGILLGAAAIGGGATLIPDATDVVTPETSVKADSISTIAASADTRDEDIQSTDPISTVAAPKVVVADDNDTPQVVIDGHGKAHPEGWHPDSAAYGTAFDEHTAPIAKGVDDSMSFNEAFKTARAETGAGGIFYWHGEVYDTFYDEELDSKGDPIVDYATVESHTVNPNDHDNHSESGNNQDLSDLIIVEEGEEKHNGSSEPIVLTNDTGEVLIAETDPLPTDNKEEQVITIDETTPDNAQVVQVDEDMAIVVDDMSEHGDSSNLENPHIEDDLADLGHVNSDAGVF